MPYNPGMVKPTMIASLNDYVAHGTPKGSFLTAVLCNDLCGAAACADEESFETLAHITGWCYNHVPVMAWKSKENYTRWLKAHEQVRNEKGYTYPLENVYIEIEKMEEGKVYTNNGTSS